MFVIMIILIVKFEFLNRFTCKLKWICDNSVLRFSPIANKINTARAEVSFLWVLVVSLTPLQFELRVTFASDALNILFHFHFTPTLLFSLGFFSIFGTTLGISVRASGPIDASSDRDSLKWVIIYHWLHFVAEVLCCWQLWQLEQLRQLCDSGQLQFALLSFFLFFLGPSNAIWPGHFNIFLRWPAWNSPLPRPPSFGVVVPLIACLCQFIFQTFYSASVAVAVSVAVSVQLLGNFVYKSN